MDDEPTGNYNDECFEYVPQRAPQPTVPAAFHIPQLNGHDVFELPVDELQHLYTSKSFSVSEYVQFCLDRIQAANPYLGAVIETNPDALGLARTLDRERADGRSRGALHGVPVLVKDSMATADRMQTTAGSWALLGCIVPKDAYIVSRLRNAGAVIVGKSNLDEWAGMRCSDYSTGYSARGGQTRNPYDLTKSPEGSSSGSAVSVSANLVPLAFGTETDTSIIGPAIVNGVVGIKPTVGLTSRSGIVPISETQDSAGSYGRTVADAVRALDVIAGPDPEDAFSTVPQRKQPRSYIDYLSDRKVLKGARFGLPMKRFWDVAPSPQRKLAEKVIDWIREAGAEVVEVEMPSAEDRVHPDGHWDWRRWEYNNPSISEITISKVQTYYLMNRYLSHLENTPIKSLEDIVRFNDDNGGSEGGHEQELPAFRGGQELFRKCVDTQGIKDETYYAALHRCQTQCRQNGIDAALEYNGAKLDALLFCDIKMAGQCIAAQAGYPIIAVPIGVDPDGIPVSLSFQHTAWEEAKLVKWASAVEDLLLHKQGPRRTPLFRNHLRKNVPVHYAWKYEGAPT